MTILGKGRCAYCKEPNVPLRRLHSTEFVEMIQSFDASYTPHSTVCFTCARKIQSKFKRRIQSNRLQQRRATLSDDEQTSSYSDISNEGLSSSPSPSPPRRPTGVSRNVAKRTGGPPTRRCSNSTSRQTANDPDEDLDSDQEMVVVLPSQSANRSSPQIQQTSTSSSSNQSHLSNVDHGNDEDDDDNGNGNGKDANQTDNAGSVSSPAPTPSDRHQRAQLSPNRTISMISSERPDTLRNYKCCNCGYIQTQCNSNQN